MKTQYLLTTGLLTAALVGGVTRSAQAAFVDDFDNGIATQVASESPHQWVAATGGASNDGSIATEAGGLLTLTAKNADPLGAPQATISDLHFGALSTDLNFWTHPVTIKVSDVVRSGTEVDNGQNFYVTIVSQAETGRDTNSALELRILGGSDFARFGSKVNAGSNVSQNLFGFMKLAAKNQTTAYFITIDGTGAQLTYDLSFSYSGVNGLDSNANGLVESTDAGKGNLAGSLSEVATTALRAQWLLDNGVANVADASGALALSVIRSTSVTANDAVATVGRVEIIPEPATLSLLAIGGAMMLWRRK